VNELWNLFPDMLHLISMRTLLSRWYSICFIMQHSQIEPFAASHSVRSIYFLRILSFQNDIFRERISRLGVCHLMCGIPPRYHILYRNICILSRIGYTLCNSYMRYARETIYSSQFILFVPYSSYY
jgi:hypothetical protein